MPVDTHINLKKYNRSLTLYFIQSLSFKPKDGTDKEDRNRGH